MSTIDITISCPHCRRQYTMKTDPERLQRVKTRATCGRCRNSFDVASRIVAPSGAEPPTETPAAQMPKLRPPPAPKPKRKEPAAVPSPNELTELAREFADAAARFTPVGVRPPGLAAALAPSKTGSSTAVPALQAAVAAQTQIPTRPDVKPLALPDESAWVLPRTEPPKLESETPTAEVPRPAPLVERAAQPPRVEPPPEPAPPVAVAPAPAVPVEPPPAMAEPPPAAVEEAVAAPPSTPASGPASGPASWIDRADPGIDHLVPPPSPAAAALEQLL